ncbi:hypothetical protein M0813_29815 [Anaeramoeba flamelloides]|uniref:Activator of Hsp90 ATPase AHSA1-like N-terminal domain-containing protein n=1 Tax=Anaeramoeba flamelloides TaxID=1746091 RepID=A0AAV7Z9Z7_9EUKA|nr:hypothetical protein M0812_16782 [Anaeramoeba flamelloides]KAJ6233509.1 hypothetical protein M0813_29815 [Anaeramoeba flamelloides]
MSKWNVGNFHWEEINLNKWAKERLEELITNDDLAFGDFEAGKMMLESVEVSGDAYINVRRGKRIPGWELTIQIKIKGHITGSEESIKKKYSCGLKFRNVAEGEEEHEYIVTHSCDKKFEQVPGFLQKKVVPKVLEQIRILIKEIREK